MVHQLTGRFRVRDRLLASVARLRAATSVGRGNETGDSLHVVFQIGAPVALLAFALTWLLKEVPLRDRANLASDDAGPPAKSPATARDPASL